MDESIDEFKQNFQIIKEKKLKLAQISKFLSPSQSFSSQENKNNNNNNNKTDSSSTNSNSIKPKSSLSKLNETVKEVQAQVHSKSKSKLKTSKSTISNYFVSPKNPITEQISSSNPNTSNKSLSTDHTLNTFKCPLCSTNLTNFGESERQKHVNECLDKDFSNKSSKNRFKLKDDAKAFEDNVEEYSTTSTSNESANSTPLELSVKQNSTSGNSEERQKKLNENLLRDAVPNCPICGKVLQNMNTRQNHLKKCSQVFHIKTDALVELVKKQQEKLERDLAKGLIPSDVYFIKPKVITKKEKITNRVLQLEQPISKQEEHLQAAIALSNSLNPAENCPTKAEIKIFKKSKKSNDTPLTTTDEDTRLILLTTRLTSILDNKINYKSQSALEVKTKKASFVKTKFDSSRNYLWNRCRYFEESEEAFYVKIFLESGKFLVGHQIFIDKTNEEKFSSVELLNTQTAYLLADLNDQTQENISVFYTQLNQTQREQENQALSNYSFNPTQYYAEIDYKHIERKENNTQEIKRVDDTDDYNKDIQTEIRDISLSQKNNVSPIINATNNSNESKHEKRLSLHIKDNSEPISNSNSTFLKEDVSLTQINNKILTLTNNIFENSTDIMNSPKDVSKNDEDICIVDDTLLSSSSPMSISSSSRINLTNDNNDFEQNNSNSLSKTNSNPEEENLLEKNIEFIDVTTSSNESLNTKSPTSKIKNKNNSKRSSDSDGLSIEENSLISNKLDKFSRKRKSIQIINLEENTDPNEEECLISHSEDFKQDNAKKFKIAATSNIICLDEEEDDYDYKKKENLLDSSNKTERPCHSNTDSLNITEIEKKSKQDCLNSPIDELVCESKKCLSNISNKSNQSIDDDLECTNFEKNSLITKTKTEDSFRHNNNNELLVISSDSSNDRIETLSKAANYSKKDETYLNESKILMMLNQTEDKNFETKANDEENEVILDEVWNNFDGNQFDDYGDYNADIMNDSEFKEKVESENSLSKSKRMVSDEELVDIVLENSKEKNKSILKQSGNTFNRPNLDEEDEDDLIDYDELELVLNNVEETHAASQRQKSFSENEKTPICLKNNEKIKNKNLTKVQNQNQVDMNMSALTPMPSYSTMDTPNLRDNLKRFGIKPLSKKQAVKKLVEIYEFTHKHKLQRSQSCNDLNSEPSKEKEFVVPKPKPVSSITNLNFDLLSGEELLLEQAAREMNLEKVSKPTKKKTLKKTVSDIGYQMNSGTTSQHSNLLKIGVKPKKKPSQKALQECTLDEQMLEIIENDDSDASGASPSLKSSQLLQLNKKNKTLDAEESRQIISDLIKGDENLYLSILNYEPVDYESFLNRIQDTVAPRKINQKYLMHILDEYCITFTLKSLNSRGGGKVKSKKKT